MITPFVKNAVVLCLKKPILLMENWLASNPWLLSLFAYIFTIFTIIFLSFWTMEWWGKPREEAFLSNFTLNVQCKIEKSLLLRQLRKIAPDSMIRSAKKKKVSQWSLVHSREQTRTKFYRPKANIKGISDNFIKWNSELCMRIILEIW